MESTPPDTATSTGPSPSFSRPSSARKRAGSPILVQALRRFLRFQQEAGNGGLEHRSRIAVEQVVPYHVALLGLQHAEALILMHLAVRQDGLIPDHDLPF